MSSSPETEALKKDMEKLRQDLSALAEAVKNSSRQHAREGMDAARAKFDEARREAAGQAEQVGDQIKERPFTSVLAALGIGLLIGKLISR